MYIQFYNKNLKKQKERGKKEQNSSHTNKKLIGAHGSHWETLGANRSLWEPIGANRSQMKKINLGWVSGGASSSIIFSSIGENFGA